MLKTKGVNPIPGYGVLISRLEPVCLLKYTNRLSCKVELIMGQYRMLGKNIKPLMKLFSF